MKKTAAVTGLLILLLLFVAVFYFDILGLQTGKAGQIAEIIYYEDTRNVSPKLMEYLSDTDSDLRARAALAVGRIGKAGTIEKLFPLLDDTIPHVAETAAFAIGLSDNKKHAHRLLRNCDIYPPDLQAMAIQSAGRLADSSMSDIIETLAGYLGAPDHRVREQAAYALFRCKGVSASDKLIDACRNDAVRPVRIAAMYSLIRLKISEPVDMYEEWLPDSEPFVRSLALRGLAMSKDDITTRLVAGGLNDRDNNVVAQAVYSLAKIGTPVAKQYLLDRFKSETDEKLKIEMLNAFARLGDTLAVDFAYDVIHGDPRVNVVAAAVRFLSITDGEKLIPILDSLLETSDNYLTGAIAEALGVIGGESVKPRLVTLFNDSIPAIRSAAFKSLCVADSVNAGYYIETALKDTDHVIVMTAIDYIGMKNLEKYLPPLMTIMKMGESTEIDLRRSAVASAGLILEKDIGNKLAEDIVYHGIMDNEYLVSREAAEVYKDVLDVDKSSFVNRPIEMVSSRKMASFLKKNIDNNPHAVIQTPKGEIEIELYVDVAPLAVYNFIRLVEKGYYSGCIFHRIIPNFVVQGGALRESGEGGSGYYIRGESSDIVYGRGTVGMADSGVDAADAQFFITLTPQPHLDGRYTVFGQVISGMETVERIVRGDKIDRIKIIEITDD